MGKDKNKTTSPLMAVIGFSLPTWVSFGISFLAIPVIAAIYMPSEVAKINLYNTWVNFFLMIVYFGLDQAYIRFYYECKTEREKQSLLMYCMSFSVLISIVLSALISVFGGFVSYQIAGERGMLIPFCLCASMLLNSVFRYLNVIDRMESNIFLYSVGTILMSLVTKVLYVISAFSAPSYKTALASMVLGQVVVVAILTYIHRKEIVPKSFFPFDKGLVADLFRFGLPLLPVTVLSWLNNSLSSLILRNFLTFEALGVYTLAVSAASCISLIQSGINVFWTPFSYANYKDGNDKIINGHKYITTIMVFAGIMMTVLEDVIFIILGEKYYEAKAFFPFLLVSPICYTIAETTAIGTNIAKKTYMNIVAFVCSVLVNFVFSIALLKTMGLVGAAIAAALGGVTMLIIKTYIGQKYYDATGKSKHMVFGVAMMMLTSFLNYYFMGQAILKFSSFGIILVVCSIFYRKEIMFFITYSIDIIKSIKVKIQNR
ncbi:MAG: oligosaccharide flippase family protein [Oscillospiraceae bacterium]